MAQPTPTQNGPRYTIEDIPMDFDEALTICLLACPDLKERIAWSVETFGGYGKEEHDQPLLVNVHVPLEPDQALIFYEYERIYRDGEPLHTYCDGSLLQPTMTLETFERIIQHRAMKRILHWPLDEDHRDIVRYYLHLSYAMIPSLGQSGPQASGSQVSDTE